MVKHPTYSLYRTFGCGLQTHFIANNPAPVPELPVWAPEKDRMHLDLQTESHNMKKGLQKTTQNFSLLNPRVEDSPCPTCRAFCDHGHF